MTCLEKAYYWSQIFLTVIALFALVAALIQLRTFKLMELLKFLEASDIRAARRTVVREISKRDDEWWKDVKDGDRLEKAAAQVCAAYDILGRMIEFDRIDHWIRLGSYGRFFQRHWARSILDNHAALERFLAYRQQRTSAAYEGFTDLVEAVKHLGLPPAGPLQPN
jgi:hypothetical protein